MEDCDGFPQANHHIKANILWEAYKDRLGTSDSHVMFFDLEDLLVRSNELGCLSVPFSTKEIDDVVHHLTSDKSPGPYGFDTDFVKKCWPIIKHDFYDLCFAFQAGNVCLHSINGSHITLLPRWYS
jgi:hypothetical protein